MAAQSRQEALFGAAVLRRRLEKSGLLTRGNEVYSGVLEDLGVSEMEVDRFLEEHLQEVDAALAAGRRSR